MLITTELSEWLEGVRKGNTLSSIPPWSNEEEEAADVFIRLLDLCQGRNLNLGSAVLAKLEYNSKRPHRHGKEF